MTHNVNVAIVKANTTIIDQIRSKKIPHFEYNGYVLLTPFRGIKQFVKRCNIELMVFAYTDYFGGCGEQSARLLNVFKQTDFKYNSINQALTVMGVDMDGFHDCFEAVGLHKIRNNNDLKSNER